MLQSTEGSSPVFLDLFDVKILQYQTAITKLSALESTLKALETSLKNKHPDVYIIPLINYILSLCEGPIFNVHLSLRKRYRLLCQFKLCKLTEVPPIEGLPPVEVDVLFPDVTEDPQFYSKHMYNRELQWKLFHSLVKIIENGLNIYNKQLEEAKIERNLNISNYPFGRSKEFNFDAINDLWVSPEATIALDMAVLITEFKRDTSIRAFRKLQLQLLKIAINGYQDKVMPFLFEYFDELKDYTSSQGGSLITQVQNLSNWEYTLHRIYVFIYKALSYMDILTSLLRQIYYPNKEYFQDIKIKLRSKNIQDFEEVIQMVDDTCLHCRDEEVTQSLIVLLENNAKPGSLFFVQPESVLDAYNNGVVKAYDRLKFLVNLYKSFYKVWLHIENNKEGKKSLANLSQSQLDKLLKDRTNSNNSNLEKDPLPKKNLFRKTSSSNGVDLPRSMSTISLKKTSNQTLMKASHSSTTNLSRTTTPSTLRRSTSIKRLSVVNDMNGPTIANGTSLSPPKPKLTRSVSVSVRPLSSIAQAPASPLASPKPQSRSSSTSSSSMPIVRERVSLNKRKSITDIKQAQNRQRSSSLQAALPPQQKSIPTIRSNSLNTDIMTSQRKVQENNNSNNNSLLRPSPSTNQLVPNKTRNHSVRHSVQIIPNGRIREVSTSNLSNIKSKNSNGSALNLSSPLPKKRFSMMSNSMSTNDLTSDFERLRLTGPAKITEQFYPKPLSRESSDEWFEANSPTNTTSLQGFANNNSNSSINNNNNGNSNNPFISVSTNQNFNSNSSNSSSTSKIKKVRFAGVPPIAEVDEPVSTPKKKIVFAKPDASYKTVAHPMRSRSPIPDSFKSESRSTMRTTLRDSALLEEVNEQENIIATPNKRFSAHFISRPK